MNQKLLDVQASIRRQYPLLSKYYQTSTTRIQREAQARETVQLIALAGLSKAGFFMYAAFYGGTALRILHGLDRFSEDLDFTLLRPCANFDVMPYLEAIAKELLLYDLNLSIAPKGKTATTDVISAFLKLNTKQYCLAIDDIKTHDKTNHNEEITIKLEIDTNPPNYHFNTQRHDLTVPERFSVTTIDISELFAGKMHAALYRQWKNRIKGRDWYDVVWYVNKGVPLTLAFFESCIQQAGLVNLTKSLDQNTLIKLIQERVGNIDWELAKEDVFQFLLQPTQLNTWSASFFTTLIQKLVVK